MNAFFALLGSVTKNKLLPKKFLALGYPLLALFLDDPSIIQIHQLSKKNAFDATQLQNFLITSPHLIRYPLNYCIISGEKLDALGNPVTINYKNFEMKFCCRGCLKEFYKDPDNFLKKITDITRANSL